MPVLNRRTFIAGTAIVFTSSGLRRSAIAQEADQLPEGSIEAVVIGYPDGEKLTVEIDGEEEEVRMIGIDAPEIENDDDLPECFAAESTENLRNLLSEGTVVYLERDEEDKDGKDRLWRYVWARNDLVQSLVFLVNETQVAGGFAIDRDEETNTKYEERIAVAQAKAKAANAGLWGVCGGGHVAITPVPERGSRQDPAAIGEKLTAEGMAVTLTNAYFTYEYNFSTPKGGYVFLVVEVEMTNVDDESHGYTDQRFSAKDLVTEAEFDDTFALLDTPLGSGDLSPNEYVYGQVALEVQETATSIRVKYDVSFLGDAELYWLVPKT